VEPAVLTLGVGAVDAALLGVRRGAAA
jgi:hypothetical protein